MKAILIISYIAAQVFSSGVLVSPPPRPLPTKPSKSITSMRPGLSRYGYEEWSRMSIEDLPVSLPEYDMYCRGAPFDNQSEHVQTYTSGETVNIEWNIFEADQGECRLLLVCPNKHLTRDLWKGPCGLAAGKANSKATIPSDFYCDRGECFIAWYYETSSRRRYCNCFDIHVPQNTTQTTIMSNPSISTLVLTTTTTSFDTLIILSTTTEMATLSSIDSTTEMSTLSSIDSTTEMPTLPSSDSTTSTSTLSSIATTIEMPILSSTDTVSSMETLISGSIVATEIITVMTSVIVNSQLLTLTSTIESTLISTITLQSTITVDSSMISTLPLTETVSDFKVLSGSCAPTTTQTLLLLRVTTVTLSCPTITVTSCLPESSSQILSSTVLSSSRVSVIPTLQPREKPISIAA